MPIDNGQKQKSQQNQCLKNHGLIPFWNDTRTYKNHIKSSYFRTYFQETSLQVHLQDRSLPTHGLYRAPTTRPLLAFLIAKEAAKQRISISPHRFASWALTRRSDG